MTHHILREIIENERFVYERDSINPNVKRMDEILTGVTFFVARTPNKGNQISDKKWAITTIKWDTIPLVIYYSFNKNQVNLESIIKAEEVDD